ncbi:transmembrane protein [Legionella geestiana]|uniref:Ancillary SecYEG translocon subunit n=1 Tax=Legionella geestiana TaxID=45065 RepID=A0A0W0U9K5_9GAMM|nr:tetratricopeptide repeat protein [Legionella geestiana]KTD04201.1 transmembrane protein [Legionella geestiana]QBS11624.1 tetratricopeptide repeat protein [Legionella geestiana]QDQ40766.1 tetratricopeptide repeat protein [Legionella geestiana]STX53694.1 transmembrane protein [Legionella geestiana]
MTVYRTEDEQIEAIKNFWKRYGNLITLVLSCVLLIAAGVRYWNWHTEKLQLQASATFERMMYAFSNHNNREVRSYANTLVNEYGKSVYADGARLALAKLYVEKSQYDKAQEALEQVGAHSAMPALRQVAKIRLSRVLAAQKNWDKALAALAQLDDAAYLPEINELKGDIFASTGHYQQAVASYQEAIREVRTHGMGNLFLEMKTNELAALTQAGNKNTSALQSAQV